jgi:tetratricopeptide (TPR) repeat protein
MKWFSLIIILFAGLLPLNAQKEAADLNKSGVELGNNKRFSEAISKFNLSIEQFDKVTAKTIHNIGWLYELRQEPENALIFYEEALRRSGNQIDTLERAGNVLYSLKRYDKAILYGEKVMKLDPLNQEVIKWLPDAYAQMFKLKEQNITKVTKAEEEKKVVEKVMEQKKEEQKYRRLITLTYEGMIRTTYLLAGGNGFTYSKTDSYLYNYPQMFILDITPTETWEIKASTGVPYNGAAAPNLVWWTEKIEGYFYKKNYFLGMGFMGNHYGGSGVFGSKVNLFDYKIGIIFGKYGDRSRFEVAMYPRMLPADTGTSKGKTLDVDSVDISYWYMLEQGLKIYGRLFINDYYFFDNSVWRSNYYGIYGLTLGVAINDNPSSSYVVHLDITERMYLQNLNNTKPYSFMNGQGVFGLDAYHWFKGNPMSGIKTFSTGFSFHIEERVMPRFFLFQKILMEFVTKSQRGHDFCFVLGVGGYY